MGVLDYFVRFFLLRKDMNWLTIGVAFLDYYWHKKSEKRDWRLGKRASCSSLLGLFGFGFNPNRSLDHNVQSRGEGRNQKMCCTNSARQRRHVSHSWAVPCDTKNSTLMPFALRLSVICLVPKFSSVPHPMKKYPTLLLKAFASVNTPPANVSRFTPNMAPLKVPIY